MLVEDVELDKFRRGDTAYNQFIINAVVQHGVLPNHARKNTKALYKLKTLVKDIIKHLFQPNSMIP